MSLLQIRLLDKDGRGYSYDTSIFVQDYKEAKWLQAILPMATELVHRDDLIVATHPPVKISNMALSISAP